MDQLALPLQHSLTYSPSSIHFHEGLADVISVLEAYKPGYKIFYIEGSKLSGKTHIAVWLQNYLISKVSSVTWIEGQDLANSIATLSSNFPLIIDDADFYFSNLKSGDSGPWVRLCESFRAAERQIYIFSSRPIETLPCDPHVISRLRAGTLLQISTPGDSDLPILLQLMSKQRGFELSSKKLAYLAKRVGRSIEDIDKLLEQIAKGLFVDDQGIGFSELEKLLKNRDEK